MKLTRLRLKVGLGINQIAGACNISKSTASIYVNKIETLKLSYEELSDMDEESLYKLLFPAGAEMVVSDKAMP